MSCLFQNSELWTEYDKKKGKVTENNHMHVEAHLVNNVVC